jgi:hypothetical protein
VIAGSAEYVLGMTMASDLWPPINYQVVLYFIAEQKCHVAVAEGGNQQLGG